MKLIRILETASGNPLMLQAPTLEDVFEHGDNTLAYWASSYLLHIKEQNSTLLIHGVTK